MERKRYGIIGTIAIHLLVILFVLKPFTATQKRTTSQRTTISLPENLVLITLPGGDGIASGAVDINGNLCDSTMRTYDGVGFLYEPSTGQVLTAPIMMPAYQAGIRVGDLLLNNPSVDATGVLELDILKFGNTTPTIYHIKAIKICFKEAK